MGIDKNTYTVTLRKSINDVRVIKWRRMNSKSNTHIGVIPYKLATFLNLIPNDFTFTNKLYDLSHEELDELKADNDSIKRVTRKNGNVILTIDLSKV